MRDQPPSVMPCSERMISVSCWIFEVEVGNPSTGVCLTSLVFVRGSEIMVVVHERVSEQLYISSYVTPPYQLPLMDVPKYSTLCYRLNAIALRNIRVLLIMLRVSPQMQRVYKAFSMSPMPSASNTLRSGSQTSGV